MKKAIVSIDIGIENLAVVVMTDYNNSLSDITLQFDLYNLNNYCGRNKIIISRCNAVKSIIKTISQNYIIDKIIIERQVQQNTIAYSMMYGIVSIALFSVSSEDIIIFDPKNKFTSLGISYTTKNKEHKKLSISLINNFLTNIKSKSLLSFNVLVKKDDVADAILQALVVISEANDTMKLLRYLLTESQTVLLRQSLKDQRSVPLR